MNAARSGSSAPGDPARTGPWHGGVTAAVDSGETAAGPGLLVPDAVQRAPLLPSRRAGPLLVRHQDQEPAPCARRVADPDRLGHPPADQELRPYWPERPILDGARTPPPVTRLGRAMAPAMTAGRQGLGRRVADRGKALPAGCGTWPLATAGGTAQMSGLSEVDIKRMRDQLFVEGPERNRRLSRYRKRRTV
jgi:hypothetical protein